MKEIEFIQKLDKAIGDPPLMDVSDQIMRRIRSSPVTTYESGSLWLPAMLSTLAAAAVLLVAVQSISGLLDPFGDLLTPLWTAFQ